MKKSAYTEALALVAALLEQDGTVQIVQFDVERAVLAVTLQSPINWTSFVGEGHIVKRLLKRVDEPDIPDYCTAIQRMMQTKILVPAVGHWALKMPGGYAILGDGDQGVSCTSKREAIAKSQQLTDNPVLDDYQNRRWWADHRSL